MTVWLADDAKTPPAGDPAGDLAPLPASDFDTDDGERAPARAGGWSGPRRAGPRADAPARS